MRQDAPRNDSYPDDGLLDFDSEALNSAGDKEESDSVFVRRDSETPFNRQERDTRSSTSVTPFVWHTTEASVVHTSVRRNIGIALLMLGSVGVLAWAGGLLVGAGPDAGTSGTQIRNASQPTPKVPPETPTNAIPSPPDSQPSATDVPAKTATSFEPAAATKTPSAAPGADAPDAPRTDRPAREAERPQVNIDPNAPGGLFAITRPLGAQVLVDNKLLGTTPLFVSQLATGAHEVRLELPGFSTYSSSIQVEPNKRFRLAVQLEETR